MLTTLNSSYTVVEETFESLTSYWLGAGHHLRWDCLFVLPGWLKVWWDKFGTGQTSYLRSVRHKDEPVGIAPFMIQGETVHLMGDADVCDYLDVIVAPGRGREFFNVLLPHLKLQGISHLDLGALRADSIVLSDLVAVAKDLSYEAICEPEDVTMELELPATWDDFLYQLKGKERHEIRRKLRRLNEASPVNFRVIENPAEVSKEMDTFLELFKLNRSDKADFMTDQRAAFFQALAEEMAAARILKLFLLDVDEIPAAAVMCFDYHSTMYLYNNAYDSRHRSLSVGLLSKVFTIKESIQKGKSKYDFLKGTESYKRRLGGKPVQLYRCRIQIG